MTGADRECCWPGCVGEPVPTPLTELPVVLLCEDHFVLVGQRFIDERTVGGRRFAQIQRAEADKRFQDRLAIEIKRGELATAERARKAAVSVVYYVRDGRYIKIGYTSDLRRRLQQLRIDAADLLATEPGGRSVEAQRHLEFADERIGRREDFLLSTRLQEHIRELQEAALSE